MNSEHDVVPEREERLDEAVTSYLEAVETGQAPDRQVWLARYPEVAAELSDFFADQDRLDRLAAPLRAVAQGLASTPPPGDTPFPNFLAVGPDSGPAGPPGAGSRTIDDYKLIREIGRGGMGVVYEAEQISLNRHVALKVLPFAATMDARQLQRFQNEARAAASLEHPHIVPVYGVGCERGVHYYAMKFINGQSLAEMIHRQRADSASGVSNRPGPDTSGVASAPGAAIEIASPPASGASNRPGPDASENASPPTSEIASRLASGVASAPRVSESENRGALTQPRSPETAVAAQTERAPRDAAAFRQIAEWGIQAALALEYAHSLGIIHRDIKPANLMIDGHGALWITDFGLARTAADAGLTMTGDVLGTWRYMSPEQALAKHRLVDHRTDVYSLGLTLYELLTGTPAINGKDREEILNAITLVEPRAPRAMDAKIPPDLQTIVLKAMEKNPTDRYGTAQELAADLERFLKEEPIRAKRPTLVQRARKWGRRHPGVVATTAVALVIGLLIGAGAWISRASKRSETAGAVNEAVKRATVLQVDAKWPEALEAAQRAQALLQLGGGSAELRQRVQTLLADLKMIQRLQEARLEESAVSHDHFDWARTDALYEQAFRDFGLDMQTLKVEEAAERICSRSIQIELAAALDYWVLRRKLSQKNTSRQRLLAVARAVDADVWRNRLRDAMESPPMNKRALHELAVSAELVSLPPLTEDLLARFLAAAGEVDEAVSVLRRAQQRHADDFWINEELGLALMDVNPPQTAESVGFFRAALALRPESPGAHVNLGNALRDQGKIAEAQAEFRQAVLIQPDYSGAHNNLGNALADQGDFTSAEIEHREAIRLNPDSRNWPEPHYNLGIALEGQGKLSEAETEYREAIRLRPGYPQAHCNLGNVLKEQGKHSEAIALYQEAIRLEPNLAEAHSALGLALDNQGNFPEAVREYRQAIRIKPNDPVAHYNFGNTLYRRGNLPEAAAEFRQAIRLKSDFYQAHQNLAHTLSLQGKPGDAQTEYREAIHLKPDWSEPHFSLANALRDQSKFPEAEAEYREAIRLQPDLAESHCNLGLMLKRQGRFTDALPELRRGNELGTKRQGWRYPSADWVRQCERMVAIDAKLPALLSGKEQPKDIEEELDLAVLCQQPYKRLFAASARFYEHALTSRQQWADDLRAAHRYNAACSAALAAAGQGEDAKDLHDKERSRWRNQARTWLRADLAAWMKTLNKGSTESHNAAQQSLRHWQEDSDLDGLRNPMALSRLPAAEQEDCHKLWREVEAALNETAAKK